jgi:hypothetical protein
VGRVFAQKPHGIRGEELPSARKRVAQMTWQLRATVKHLFGPDSYFLSELSKRNWSLQNSPCSRCQSSLVFVFPNQPSRINMPFRAASLFTALFPNNSCVTVLNAAIVCMQANKKDLTLDSPLSCHRIAHRRLHPGASRPMACEPNRILAFIPLPCLIRWLQLLS